MDVKMTEEREEKIEELEKLNELLNPQKFVKHKQELEKKEKVLKILESKNIQSDIEKLKLKLHKKLPINKRQFLIVKSVERKNYERHI